MTGASASLPDAMRKGETQFSLTRAASGLVRARILLCTVVVPISLFLAVSYFRSLQSNSSLQKERASLTRELEQARQSTIDEAAAGSANGSSSAESQQARDLSLEANLTRSAQLLTNALTENQALRGQIDELQKALLAPPPEIVKKSPAAATENQPRLNEEQIEAYLCLNQLSQISFATETWARAHDGYAPTNFMQLSEYLAPMILVCPSAQHNALASGGPPFNPSMITYQMENPGAPWHVHTAGAASVASIHFARGPIHQIGLLNEVGSLDWPSKYGPFR